MSFLPHYYRNVGHYEIDDIVDDNRDNGAKIHSLPIGLLMIRPFVPMNDNRWKAGKLSKTAAFFFFLSLNRNSMLLQESVRLTGESGEEAVFPSVGKPQKGMSLPLDIIIMSHGDRCLLGEFFFFNQFKTLADSFTKEQKSTDQDLLY